MKELKKYPAWELTYIHTYPLFKAILKMIFARIRRWDSCWFPGSTKRSQTLSFDLVSTSPRRNVESGGASPFFFGEEPPRSHRIDDVQTGCNAIRILVDFSTFGWFRFTLHNGTKQNDAK